jgi:hypothetical protein
MHPEYKRLKREEATEIFLRYLRVKQDNCCGPKREWKQELIRKKVYAFRKFYLALLHSRKRPIEYTG